MLFFWGSVIFKIVLLPPPPPPPPPPRKQAWSSGNFSSDGVPLCWQKHINCPHFEKEDNMNETEAFIMQLCGTIIGIVPQSCVMNASVSFILSSFSKWGQLCFCQHSWFNGMPSDEKIPAASSLLAGGKVAHFENDTASENSTRIKTPYPYLMNLVSNYLENNILSNTAKINGIQSRMLLK